jgi:hypothetical protein
MLELGEGKEIDDQNAKTSLPNDFQVNGGINDFIHKIYGDVVHCFYPPEFFMDQTILSTQNVDHQETSKV